MNTTLASCGHPVPAVGFVGSMARYRCESQPCPACVEAAANPVHVLISLHPGYGLGDHVQLTSVARHLLAARPHWQIDFQGDAGKSDAMLGLVRRVFTHGDGAADPSAYDRIIDINLYDTLADWTDRPNTRVAACLHEKFGLPWVRELGGYRVAITEEAMLRAPFFLPTPPTVAFHCAGMSAMERKDLTFLEASGIRNAITGMNHHCLNMPATPSAQLNCAIISQCSAFIGIDSGPSKCAAATSTPSLVCWTKNHPALYFDPAPNVTHLVPVEHRTMDVFRGTTAAVDWFEANYNFRVYDPSPVAGYDNTGLVGQIAVWLREVLK